MEVYYIFIVYYVFFIFNVKFIGFFYCLFRIQFYVVVVGNYFGMNKVFFEISVNYIGSVRCFSVFNDCLGMNFFFISGKISDEFE